MKTVLAALLMAGVLWVMVGGGIPSFHLDQAAAVAENAKTALQTQLNENETFKRYGMVVDNVIVIQKTTSTYDGIAEVTFNGTKQMVPLEITDDGKQSMFQTKPLAFAFIAQYEMEQLINTATELQEKQINAARQLQYQQQRWQDNKDFQDRLRYEFDRNRR